MWGVFFYYFVGVFFFQTLAERQWLNLVIVPPASYPSTRRHWSQPLAASKSPVSLFKVKVKELLPFQTYHLSKLNALLQLILFVTTGYRSAGGLYTGKLVDCPSAWLYPGILKAPAREVSIYPFLLHNPGCKITALIKCFLMLLPPAAFSSQVYEKEGYLLAISLLILLLNDIIALSETARSKWHKKDLGCDLAAGDNAKLV